MFRFIKYLLPLLAVLAFGCAQVYGMKKGYLCDCNGVPVELSAEHCHRPSGEVTSFVPCVDKCDGTGNSQKESGQNKPLTVELKSSSSTLGSVLIPSFVPHLIAEIPCFVWLMVQIEAQAETGLNNIPPDSEGGHLLSSVQVAKCMVLLV